MRRASVLDKALAIASLVASLLWATVARAELGDEATTLAEAYRRGGAEEVTRLEPRFALASSVLRIPLPDVEGLGEGPHPCVTVVALAAPTHRFDLRPALPRALRLAAPAVASAAGVATLEDCSGKRLGTGAIEVTMGNRPGAIETVVVRHAPPSLSDPSVVLVARATGQAPAAEPVGALPLAPIDARQQRLQAAARRDGATFVARVDVKADRSGRGSIVLRLREGCQRVMVLADPTAVTDGVDVDALARLPEGREPLARDRSHAPDARLDFCIGQTREVELHFAGAGGPTAVMILAAHWPLPAGLPTIWGPEARAGFAWALHRRPTPAVDQSPTGLFAGASGVTALPVEVEPSSCYLAAMTVTRGEASSGRLTVSWGAHRRHDDAVGGRPAAAVSFCTGAFDRRVRLQVDMRGQAGWWGLGLWRLGDARR